VDDGQVSLKTKNSRVLWGQQPGREEEGEARAADKLQRLLATKLAGRETDLRPLAEARQRPLRD
jgi:hypothetical protein